MPASFPWAPIRHGGQLELAALESLKRWTPDYLAQLEREDPELGRLPAIKSWRIVGDRQRAGDLPLPGVLVISSGLAAPPRQDGDGNYSGSFALAFMVVIGQTGAGRAGTALANPQARANYLARAYCAALSAALLKDPSLGDFAAGVEFVDERYDELAPSGKEQVAAAASAYRIDVDDFRGLGRGPLEPTPDPYAPAGPAAQVAPGGAQATIEKRPIA